MATIGENLRRLRAARGLQQGDLAALMGVPQSQVSRWETDFAVPDIANLLKIATALGATIDEIVAGVDQAYDDALRRREELVHKSAQGDLSGQTRTGASPSTSTIEGDGDDAHSLGVAQTRVFERQVASLSQALIEIADIASEVIGDRLRNREQPEGVTGTKTGSGQRNRGDR